MTRISYEKDFPGAMRLAVRRALNHALARPVPGARHRPARGLRGDHRRQQHDARPVLRHRHRADRRVPVQVDHRGRHAGRPERLDLGPPARPRGRAPDEPPWPRGRGPGHRQSRRRRYRRGPRRGRVRHGRGHPDAHRHRHEHRGRGHRRDALPRGLVPGRPRLRRRPAALRDVRRRRGHRDDPARGRCVHAGHDRGRRAGRHLRLGARRRPGRAPARALDERGGSVP